MGMTQSAVADYIGVSQQVLSYWLRSGLLKGVPGGGKIGRRCDFQAGHVMQALTVVELKDQGASTQAVRRAVEALRGKHGIEDWQYEWLAVTPDGTVLWLDSEEQVVKPEDGQLFLIDVADMKRHVRQRMEIMDGSERGQEDLFADEREAVEA